MTSDVMGTEFVWWFGVVENRNDPLKVGRCQVRVCYWNEKSKSTLPTEQLMWAHPILPLNSNVVSPVKEGTLVMGFYMDGKLAQHPMMIGWVPGIPDQPPTDPSEGFSDPRTSDELQNAPRPPQNVQYKTDGTGVQIQEAQSAQRYPYILNEPSTYRLARNENTQNTILAQKQNSTLSQVPVGTGAIAMTGVDLEAVPGIAISIPAFSAGINIGGSFEICGLGISAGISAGLQFSGITLILPSISLMFGLNLAIDLLGCLLAGIKIGNSIQIDAGRLIPLLPQNKFINIRAIGNRGTTYGGVHLGTMGGIPLTSQPMWDEPPPPYNTRYPYNTAYPSESGHVFEIDDTPGAERIHTFHRSGTFMEMQPDGSQVNKVTKNEYNITMADNNNLVMGDHNTTVNGRQTNLVQQDMQETIQGAETIIVNQDSTRTILGNRTETVVKDAQETIAQNRLVNIKGTDTLIIQGTKNELIQGDYNLTIQGSLKLSVLGKIIIQTPETDITSPTFDITGTTNITGETNVTGDIGATGGITAGVNSGDTITLQHHQHGIGSNKAAATIPPTPGT